jgi:hypothetical protein
MPIFETRFNRKMPEAFDTSKSSIPVRIGVIRTTRPSWRNCVNLRVRRDALGNAGGNSGELFRVFGGLLLDQFLRFSHPSERGSDRETPLLSSLQHLESKAVFGLVEMGRQA